MTKRINYIAAIGMCFLFSCSKNLESQHMNNIVHKNISKDAQTHELISCMAYNNINKAKELLTDKSIDPNAVFEKNGLKYTIFGYSVFCSPQIFKLILDYPLTDPNKQFNGRTPAFVLSERGDIEKLFYLITNKKTQLHTPNSHGKANPLHAAAIFNKSGASMKFLIEQANMLPFLEIKDSRGKTPFFYACEHNNCAVIQYLILYDANPLIISDEQISLYQKIVQTKCGECISKVTAYIHKYNEKKAINDLNTLEKSKSKNATVDNTKKDYFANNLKNAFSIRSRKGISNVDKKPLAPLEQINTIYESTKSQFINMPIETGIKLKNKGVFLEEILKIIEANLTIIIVCVSIILGSSIFFGIVKKN